MADNDESQGQERQDELYGEVMRGRRLRVSITFCFGAPRTWRGRWFKLDPAPPSILGDGSQVHVQGTYLRETQQKKNQRGRRNPVLI